MTARIDHRSAAHLTEDVIALLAEGRGGAASRDEAVAHLARCRRCMAAYEAAVELRGDWLLQRRPPPQEASVPLIPHRRRPRRSPPILLVAASLLLVVGATTWLRMRPSDLGAHLPSSLRLPVERASALGLVIPGGEAGAAQAWPSYRSDAIESATADSALEALRHRYEGGDRSLENLYALAAGLLATGQIDLAGDYVAEGLRLAPRAPRFLVLAAILSHRAGDTTRSLELLNRARAVADDPTILLDLSLVCLESQRTSEAAYYLREVIERWPRSAVARRARREQERLPG